ncbi:MAG: zinc ABC transporter solute-binding protein [bacterium]|nr:zinc ABC transporter solute-binding protein [bacterium]
MLAQNFPHFFLRDFFRSLVVCIFLGGFPSALKAENAPALKVVVTLSPLGSIVKSVMKGVAEPIVLLHPLASPHEGSLTPSQAHNLLTADIIFWVGPTLESYLEKPIQTLGTSARVISLIQTEDLTLLPVRGPCCSHSHHPTAPSHPYDSERDSCDEDTHHECQHLSSEDSAIDPHIWLFPENAQLMALEIAKTLSTADPAHETLYYSNAKEFIRSVQQSVKDLKKEFTFVGHKHFLVMHDGYQYFEKAFGLMGYKNVILADDHGLGTSLKSLREILKNMSTLKPSCVLAEKSGQTRFPALVADILKTRLVWTSPMGDDYTTLLQTLGQDFIQCLGNKK